MANLQKLHLLNAHEVVEMLRKGAVTPTELIGVVNMRILQTNNDVRATPTTCFKRALEAAKALKIPKDPPPGYLYGLPVLIKDTHAVEGVRFTQGSPILSEYVAKVSALHVQALEAHGAIVVGKTNCPEWGMGSHTFNPMFGTTVSPWDTRTSAGGSSGGAAAALACCQCWLADGSDLGGSLRIPAAFCGVIGFRVSPGLVPLRDATQFWDLHTINGPMARCTRDTGLFLDAMSGNEGWALPAPTPPLPDGLTWEEVAQRGAKGEGSPSRVAFSTLGIPINPAVEALCRRAAAELANAGEGGNGVQEVQSPFNLQLSERAFMILRAAQRGDLLKLLDRHPEWHHPHLMKPEAQWNCVLGTLPEVQDASKEVLSKDLPALAREVATLFNQIDILCVPATADAAFNAEVRYPEEEEGVAFTNYLEWMKPAWLLTITNCPVLSMPCGFLEDGRPVGVQLVGPVGGDAAVLRAAALLEARLGLPKSCPVPRCGSVPLNTKGPTTAEAAEKHHAGEAARFVDRYARPSKL